MLTIRKRSQLKDELTKQLEQLKQEEEADTRMMELEFQNASRYAIESGNRPGLQKITF